MTLRPRRSSHRNHVGWAKVKTGPSRGWGLPRKWPKIHGFKITKKRVSLSLLVLLISMIVFGAMYLDPNNSLFHSYVSNPAYCQPTQEEIQLHLRCGDPFTVLWQDRQNSLNSYNSVNTVFSSTDGTGQNDPSLKLTATASQQAVALTKNKYDFSTISGKEFFTSVTFTTSTGCCTNGATLAAIYFTTNGTVPQPGGYSPYTDASVALLVTVVGTGGGAYNAFLFMQRDGTKTISQQDNGCPSQNACYLPLTVSNDPHTGFQNVAVDLNFTGRSQGGTCNSVSGAGDGCSNMGMNPQVGGAATPGTSQAAPPFQFQGVQYYIGFWEATNAMGGGGALSWYWSFDNGPQGENDYMALSASHPQACTASTPCPQPLPSPTIDEGGFFGPIIKALINIGVFILQAIEVFLGFVASAVQTGLNAIGNFFGWGNIGTTFITTVTGIVNTILQAATAVANFLANLVSRGLDLLTIVTTFSSVFFTGIQKFLSEMSTITGGIVTIFSKLFLYGGAFYFLYDIILYFQLTGDAGFEGVGTWIGFNKWAAFSIFGLISRILNTLINAFDWILSHIPTIAPKMPENGFPGIPQLTAGDFPGLRIPTGHVAKLREGDPAAFFLWAVGGFLILPFYLGSAISPLSGLVAAVGCNPTTCFNNMLTTVGYPFAGLFIIIFVGVTISEMIGGITDVGGQRIVIQNKLPAGFGQFKKAAKGEFQFGTGRFAQFKKGRAKQAKSKAVERQETISREQAYENKHGSSVFS